MKIAIVTDKSREELIPLEEAQQEDDQKNQTAREIKNVLSKKYNCISLVADDDIIQVLKSEKVDLVFNLCNGIQGLSRIAQLPAMLEYANIPYTGSAVLGHALAINKIFASTIFKNRNIPTPKFIEVRAIEDIAHDMDLKYPIIVKPNDEGSSRGIHQDSLVFNKESLLKKVEEGLEIYNPPIMLNEYVEGREFSIGILGNGEETRVIGIQEVDLSDLPEGLLKFYSFEIKAYYKSHTKYHIPADLRPDEKKIIEETALKAYNALELKDYARVDIILKDGIPYVLEINSLPGLMKDKSSLYRMAEATDLGYEDLIMRIVDCAIKRYNINIEE